MQRHRRRAIVDRAAQGLAAAGVIPPAGLLREMGALLDAGKGAFAVAIANEISDSALGLLSLDGWRQVAAWLNANDYSETAVTVLVRSLKEQPSDPRPAADSPTGLLMWDAACSCAAPAAAAAVLVPWGDEMPLDPTAAALRARALIHIAAANSVAEDLAQAIRAGRSLGPGPREMADAMLAADLRRHRMQGYAEYQQALGEIQRLAVGAT